MVVLPSVQEKIPFSVLSVPPGFVQQRSKAQDAGSSDLADARNLWCEARKAASVWLGARGAS
jgi:hypothetical protein